MKKLPLICLLVFANLIVFAAPQVKVQAAISPHVPSVTCTWIAFMPVILVAVAIFMCLIALKKSDISFSSLLAEKDTEKKIRAVNGGVTTDTSPASTTRFIVFLTGITGLILGSCMTTFFIYQYFIDPTKPADLSNLNIVLVGLGIGVIPYGFNKVAAGVKN